MDPISALFFAVYSAFEVGGIGFSATALTVMSYASTAAVLSAGSYFLNRALAPSIKDTARGGARVAPQTTQEEGGALQQVYGTNRCHANVVGSFTVIPSRNTMTRGKDVTRRIQACFGEGPWAAEPAAASIKINGQPLADFAGLTATWRLGTTNQTVLNGWTPHRQDYHQGKVLLYGSPITVTLGRAGWDDLEIILEFPNGCIHYGTDGNSHSESLLLRIEVGDAIADTWQTVLEKAVGGEVAQPCYISFRASETYTGGTPFTVTPAMQPRARITKLSGDSTNTRHIQDIEVYAVQAFKNVAFTHPGYVLLGLSLVPKEAVEGGISELSCVSTGRVVADEAGVFAVTRYHGDVIRDILTQPVIEGDGGGTPYSASYFRGLDEDRLIGTGWSDQKTLADQTVPDGSGSTDALLRCDVIFSGDTTAHAAIQQVAVSGRCGLDFRGRDMGLWVEDEGTVVGILCDGSWEVDSAELMPVEADDLASSGTAHYRDVYADYESRPVRAVDSTLATLAQVDLDLVAETRMHGAARLLRRELVRNHLLDLSLRCRADIDSVLYEPGDVLYAQIDGKSLGGRLVAVSADGLTLTVDRDLTDVSTGTDGVAVQVHDPLTEVQSVEDQTALLTGPRTVVVPAAWTVTPVVGDVFLFGPSTITDDWFEVAEIAFDQRLHADISLIKYVTDALDALDELAPDIDVPLSALLTGPHGLRRRDLDGDVMDSWVVGATVTYAGEVVTYYSDISGTDEVVTYGS